MFEGYRPVAVGAGAVTVERDIASIPTHLGQEFGDPRTEIRDKQVIFSQATTCVLQQWRLQCRTAKSRIFPHGRVRIE
jgi:hypothetical protein